MLNKIQLIFKSFLVFLFIDTLFLIPAFLFLEINFLVAIITLLVVLNILFCFSIKQVVTDNLDAKNIYPKDRYGIWNLIEDEEGKGYALDIFISKLPYPFSLSYRGVFKPLIVFSECLWDSLSEKERAMLVRYHLFQVKKRWAFRSTLASHLCYNFQNIFFFTKIFQFLFKKRKKEPNNISLSFLRILGLLTRVSRVKKDLEIAPREQDRKILALLLWKIQSLYELQNHYPLPLYFVPLLPSNPLTSLKKECYIAFQPNIKARVRSLVGSYPP